LTSTCPALVLKL